MDAGYGNNTSFLQKLENRKLKYIGGIAKNRKVIIQKTENKTEERRVDNLTKALPVEAFTIIQLPREQPITVWVAIQFVELSKCTGKKVIAIVMNAETFDTATEIDYLMSNVDLSTATPGVDSKNLFTNKLGRSFLSGSQGLVGVK
jgi:diphthamide synthase subunit DPH2